MQITVRAPTRVDLIGGTIDLAPIHHVLLGEPTTVNIAIDLWAEVSISIGADQFMLSSENYGTEFKGSFVSNVTPCLPTET